MSIASVLRLPSASGSPIRQQKGSLCGPLPEGVADLRPLLAAVRASAKGNEAHRLNAVRELARRLATDDDPRIERRVLGFAVGIGCRDGRAIAARVLREVNARGARLRR